MKTVWKDNYVIDVYNLAKSGMTDRKIAQVLGITHHTFAMWTRTTTKRKNFRLAFQRGRKEYRGKNGKTYSFKDYVFKRLSLDLRSTWNRINKLDKKANSFEMIDAILENKGKNVRQHLFVYAWVSSNFSTLEALRKVCLSRGVFDLWKKDPEFAEMVKAINEYKKDFFEDQLCNLVARGDTSATIFANSTKNRDRGYDKRVGIDMDVKGQLDTGNSIIDFSKLSLRARKELLQLTRQTNK